METIINIYHHLWLSLGVGGVHTTCNLGWGVLDSGYTLVMLMTKLQNYGCLLLTHVRPLAVRRDKKWGRNVPRGRCKGVLYPRMGPQVL